MFCIKTEVSLNKVLEYFFHHENDSSSFQINFKHSVLTVVASMSSKLKNQIMEANTYINLLVEIYTIS